MPYPPQVFSLDGHAFGLTVNGVQIIKSVPTDFAPIRWDMPSDTNVGLLEFTILDTGETTLTAGDVVRLTDNVNNDTLMAGPLIGKRPKRVSGQYRGSDCKVAGWNWFLDNREVTEFITASGAGPDDHCKRLMQEWGGGIEATSETVIGWGGGGGSTATRVTLRGAVDGMVDALGGWDAVAYYVDNERRFHTWDRGDDPRDSSVVGTATSIGDQGTFVPEYLTWDEDYEQHLGYAYPYSDGTAVLHPTRGGQYVAPAGQAQWSAGDPSATYDTDYSGTYVTTMTQMSAWLRDHHGYIDSISFTTTEYDGWRPHQEIVIDDTILTGGAASTAYIEAVSGTIDHRNVIEWRIEIGAPHRSIVQTVATP